MIRIRIPLDDPAGALTAFGAGAVLRLERSATELGAYAEIATTAVDADTALYTLFDTAGDDTSWYRWRLSNAANSDQSPYAAPFQGEEFTEDAAPLAYATLDDFNLISQQDVSTDGRRAARAQKLLERASRQLDVKLGFDVRRHPATGTEQRYFTARSPELLCIHDGIADSDTLTVAVSEDDGATYTDVAAADYYTEPHEPTKPGFPIFHLRLTGRGTLTAWPRGKRLVRVDTQYGWPAVPSDWTEATIARAHQLIASDPTLGGVQGPEELGRLVAYNRMPDPMYQLTRDYAPIELMFPCWL